MVYKDKRKSVELVIVLKLVRYIGLMIKRIKVRNAATYDDVGVTIENIETINYIYGANGCGKTTISNFLDNMEENQFTDCEAEWESTVAEKVFVYNKAFRERNFRESDIAGIFTLGQATTDEIDEINQKKVDLVSVNKNIIASSKTIDDLKGKIQLEESEFKEIIWKDVYKTNEAQFKNAFVGFLKKDAFSEKLKGTIVSETENIDRSEIEKRALKLLGEPPVKKACLSKLSAEKLKGIEKLAIWEKCIVGKNDIPIARLIKKLENGDWVNQGRKYIIYSGTKCPFCQKDTIDDDFRKQLESFFDEEFERDVEEVKDKKEEYIKEKANVLSAINDLVNQDFEEDEKLLIQHLYESLEKCIQTNEGNMEDKIKEPGKKIVINCSNKYIDEINAMIDKKNNEIIKHNNLVDNYQEEKRKLISDIWILVAKENSTLISQHNKKIDGFNRGVQSAMEKRNQYEIQKKNIELEIREKNKRVTSVQPAVDEINRLLHNYGFNNFSITPSTEKNNHYQIKRPNGTLVESTLSEGEVTFITFLYFLQWIKGSQNEEEVTQDRIIVIDDPISSLDSNVLFVVSSLLKDVIYKVLAGESNIKQVFVLTHNVYFHKELSFIGNGNNPNKNIHYWILRKKNDITNIQYYGMDNPISSSYELLWKELKEQNDNSVITIQNVMRRIIENYFKILGKYKDDELINKFPDYESKEICRSLLSWINDGSHCMPDDLFVEALDDSLERYQEVFKKIFEYTNHIEHYNMMMGIKENVD
ncbi:MAG: AAA family ATPase [Roseburia sp.]|nr:AAA family ATPase [Roseburia sp.]